MAKDRARDIKRSVGSHEKMMGALGRAAGFFRAEGIKDVGTVAVGGKTPGLRGQDFFPPGKGHVNVSDSPLDKRIQGAKGIQ